ncbi:MAG: N-acetylmuramic acid 6-phosphate etherase [Erysipelotrichia bacterium]|nr:N-acetylmuramic acid 6-phosphate etherase [Erysipelotrichia bacterium]
MVDLSKLTTEQRNPATMNLDQMSAAEIATAMNSEDSNTVRAISEVIPEIARAIQYSADALLNGGRIIYIGAGTSGRIGLLDAVECPPTFGVSYDTVVGLIAGGENAFIKAVEGAEDHPEEGKQDLEKISCNSKDIVIGLAASGRTPYVIGALEYARTLGCRTIAVACNKHSKVGEAADLAIEPNNGPEILTGSTRLKSGTSQKMIVNMISTGAMILNGKVYQNLMVDVKQSNEKLVSRAENIIMEATGCTRERAEQARVASGGLVKTAIVMILLNCDAGQAESKLNEAGGFVRRALEQ